jgi:DNA-binding transcriptional regulator YhcF (GntR family)
VRYTSLSQNDNSGAYVHLFHFNPAAGIPGHAQIMEQVKVALALGRLQPGDLLPSIRKVEEELGIGRMLVRKAYQQLEDLGLVRLVHGYGAVVTGQPRANGHVAAKAEALIQKLLAELRREELDPVSFSRVLQQRLLDADFRAPRILCVDSSEVLARTLGQQIQQVLGVHVRTVSLPRLRGERGSINARTQVLVNYYYVSDVRKILKGRTEHVYPVSWDYDAAFLERLRSLPLGSNLLLLFFRANLKEPATQLAIEALLDRLKEREFRIEVRPVEGVGALARLARGKHAAIVVSNRVWDEHAAVLERYPQKFVRLASRLNHQSLEAIRNEMGFVV